MPKAFSTSEKELINARLLEHGGKFFSAYGLKKTNVEEIATAVGISKGAFYSFFESKEALFMAVMEQTELQYRQKMLALVEIPGATPRIRFQKILQNAFEMVRQMPILRFITGSEYELLFSRVPITDFKDHMNSDLEFVGDLIDRCKQSGIPIVVSPEQITALLYPLVMSVLHSDNRDSTPFNGNLDLLLELIAAYCLGEIETTTDRMASGWD